MSFSEIRNFDYAVLLCRNMAKTKAFYRDVMGLAIEHDSENWVSFRIGATLLTLKPRGPSIAWDDGPIHEGSAAVQLAFRVPPPAVDTCFEELKAHRIPILREPTDLPSWRHRTLFFRDPEGNVIEVYTEY